MSAKQRIMQKSLVIYRFYYFYEIYIMQMVAGRGQIGGG